MVVGRSRRAVFAALLGLGFAFAFPVAPTLAQTEGELAPSGRGPGGGWGGPWGPRQDDWRRQQWEAQQWRQQQQWQRQQWEAQQWRQQQQQQQYYGGPVDQWGRPIRPPSPGWHVDPYTGRRERILN